MDVPERIKNLKDSEIFLQENKENFDNDCKGLEFNDIKFPTFNDVNIESQLKKEITFDSLLSDVKACDQDLDIFKTCYDSLLFKDKKAEAIKIEFKKHNMNFVNYQIFSSVLKRQIGLLYNLLLKNFKKDESAMCYLQQNFIEVDEEKIIKNLFEENFKYFSLPENVQVNCNNSFFNIFKKKTTTVVEEPSSDISEKLDLREHLYTILKIEKKLIEYDRNNKDFLPSISSLSIAMKFLKANVENAIQAISDISNHDLSEELIVFCFESCNKLEIISNFLLFPYLIPHTDLFNKPEGGEEWIRLKNHLERKVIFSRYVVKKKLQQVFNAIILGNSSVSKGYGEFNSNYLKVLGTGWYMAYFFFNKKKANIQNIKFSINPNFKVAQKIWTILDAKGIKSLLKITLPGVGFSKKYYIKRTEDELTMEELSILIDLSLSKEKLNNRDSNIELNPRVSFLIEGHHYTHAITNTYKSLEISESQSQSRKVIFDPHDLLKEKINSNIQKDYIKIKLINHKALNITQFKSVWNMIDCCSVQKNYTRNTLIIHIHGGGFIAMSPSSHENYLRKWVNTLEVPVFSIDYRLAPDNPYPKALDDVYQSYMWILKYAEDILQIKIDRIFLAGDSAGGNLCLALNYLLILKNKRQPTALFLAYPGK